MNCRFHSLIYHAFAFLLVITAYCCDNGQPKGREPQPGDSAYTARAAMQVYATSPPRALQIIDSAEIVGNIKPFYADILRAKVFIQAPVEYQLPDSAIALCRELLDHDSLNADYESSAKNRLAVLRLLCNAYRIKHDREQLLRYSTELSELNRRLGFTTEALRTEAEIAVVMTELGHTEEGLAMLNDIIRQLDVAGSVDKMDACIVAIKRKINVLEVLDRFSEQIPLAQLIINKIDHYQENPGGYADDSFRLPPGEDGDNHADYCNFCRAQAYAFLAIAYSSDDTGADKRKAKEYLDLFEQTTYGQSLGGRMMIAPAWRNLNQYDKMLATYDEMVEHMNGDTVCEDYATMLRDRALAAQHDARHREACGLWSRYSSLSQYLNERTLNSEAIEYAARYHSREQELKLEAAEADAGRKNIIIAVCVLLFVIGAAASFYFHSQRRKIKKKNSLLAQQIAETVSYKEKYLRLRGKELKAEEEKAEAEGQEPPSMPTDGDNAALFSYLYKDIMEKELYLDPTFDRQAVAERYGLSHVQVGGAFAQGSREYSSVSDFIRACRLEYACLLLTTTEMRIAEVAIASGFSRVTTFNHDFKARFNLSPTEFREKD